MALLVTKEIIIKSLSIINSTVWPYLLICPKPDSVNHKLLLQRLNSIGLGETALNCFKNHLSERELALLALILHKLALKCPNFLIFFLQVIQRHRSHLSLPLKVLVESHSKPGRWSYKAFFDSIRLRYCFVHEHKFILTEKVG